MNTFLGAHASSVLTVSRLLTEHARCLRSQGASSPITKTRRREESQKISRRLRGETFLMGDDAPWERRHLACSVNNRETVSTLEACAPRKVFICGFEPGQFSHGF